MASLIEAGLPSIGNSIISEKGKCLTPLTGSSLGANVFPLFDGGPRLCKKE